MQRIKELITKDTNQCWRRNVINRIWRLYQSYQYLKFNDWMNQTNFTWLLRIFISRNFRGRNAWNLIVNAGKNGIIIAIRSLKKRNKIAFSCIKRWCKGLRKFRNSSSFFLTWFCYSPSWLETPYCSLRKVTKFLWFTNDF